MDTGESSQQVVNRRAGKAGLFRRTCSVLARVLFHFGREAAGALSARLSLRPLFPEGLRFSQNSGCAAPRECVTMTNAYLAGKIIKLEA